MGNMPIREFQRRFKNGDFKSGDFSVQVEAGWYDWFCRDESLAGRLIKLGNAILKLESKGKVDLDNQYVFFKNNSSNYDDFRICDIKTGDVLYTICYKDAYSKENFTWTVYAICEGLNKSEDGNEYWNEYSFKNSSQLAKWLNSEGV